MSGTDGRSWVGGCTRRIVADRAISGVPKDSGGDQGYLTFVSAMWTRGGAEQAVCGRKLDVWRGFLSPS